MLFGGKMEQYFTNNKNLKSEIVKVSANINNISYYFYTDNGVFSKNEMDFGTELLLKTFKYNFSINKKVLDMGCGAGPIGIYISKLGFDVDMCDINKRAIHISKKAVKEQKLNANVFESDAYINVVYKYDYILSNPPIRVGKKKLYEIVMNAKDHLKENGEVWFVVRKDKGADSLVRDMKNVYNTVEIIEKKKGFYIIKGVI